jgi:hypothetical protein
LVCVSVCVILCLRKCQSIFPFVEEKFASLTQSVFRFEREEEEELCSCWHSQLIATTNFCCIRNHYCTSQLWHHDHDKNSAIKTYLLHCSCLIMTEHWNCTANSSLSAKNLFFGGHSMLAFHFRLEYIFTALFLFLSFIIDERSSRSYELNL